eukprot:TRINITY_DN2460_c0_g1_i3.p1 TRINITY_DN2460_c0_g1~~TRINITY_DN2460_c0_g1_i3.p1  ORF type:complete len:391 (+),score=71.29 TRINITY_DN2460_c0_g1_i3:129-1301(+)
MASLLLPFEGFATSAIHEGVAPDPYTGAVITPISLSTTFQQHTPGQPRNGFEYARTDNPTRNALEKNLAGLEGGKHAVAFSSGVAVINQVIHLLKTGDEVICMDDIYGGTGRCFEQVCSPTYGITFNYVDLTSVDNLAPAITEKTKLVWVESPTNPTMKLVDIAALSLVCKSHNLILVVDNTFMTPFFQRPLALGADIVVHSITKYINGHSDVCMGCAMLNDDTLHTRLKFLQNAVGAIPSPFDCFLVLRSTKTLHVRMQRHATNAQAVAEYLEAHDKVSRVSYPGLPSHPQHDLALRQMSGFGGMMTIYLKGGMSESRTFLETLKLFALAESLGGVESLAEHPAIMTHHSVPAERRKALGIDDTLVRLSIGIECVEDIIEDLRRALDAI